MNKVYVAHPFGGDPENVKRVENLILQWIHSKPHKLFISPIHATGFYYHEVSYAEGMGACFELLSMCDELWLCPGWEQSKGCNLEKTWAQQHGIPIIIV